MPDHHHHLEDDLWDIGPPGQDIAPEMLKLEQIPRRLWEQALSPIDPQVRFTIAHRIQDKGLRELALTVIGDLMDAEMNARHQRDGARHRGRRSAAPLPTPNADHAAIRATMQVKLRLRRDDYDRLREAADAVGMKSTTLARALVLNGAGKILQERGSA